MDKKTIEKVDLKDKRVFIRADFNVRWTMAPR
jgi:3-phosphoglycerate kinase